MRIKNCGDFQVNLCNLVLSLSVSSWVTPPHNLNISFFCASAYYIPRKRMCIYIYIILYICHMAVHIIYIAFGSNVNRTYRTTSTSCCTGSHQKQRVWTPHSRLKPAIQRRGPTPWVSIPETSGNASNAPVKCVHPVTHPLCVHHQYKNPVRKQGKVKRKF